jgi:hypothetical protein
MNEDRIKDIGAQLAEFARTDLKQLATVKPKFRLVMERLPNPRMSGLSVVREELIDGFWVAREFGVASSVFGSVHDVPRPDWLPRPLYPKASLTFLGLDLLWRKDEDEPLG